MTTANTIADKFNNDGQSFEADGQHLDDVCRSHNPSVNSDGFDKIRFDFADGSAIVIAGGAWDLAAPGCSEYCWEGAGCLCDDE